MKQTLIFLAGILSSATVMAAASPQAQWQPAQSLDTTPPVSVPGVQQHSRHRRPSCGIRTSRPGKCRHRLHTVVTVTGAT